MIRLGKPRGEKRLDLGGDAYLMYRPATTVDHEAGEASARNFFRKLREGRAALADYGLGDGGPLDIDHDAAYAVGLSSVVSLTEIAMRCVSSWSGVGDADGAALPLSRESMSALLQDQFWFRLLSEALLAPLHEVAQEGNASAPSPNGAPAGAPPIADPAASSGAPAQTAE